MSRQHNQQCTSRSQDWLDLWNAVDRTLDGAHPRGRIMHELKNIGVEEWSRWTGKCPRHDEHEGGV